jgi:hypothetical protein
VVDEGKHAACVDSWLERSAKDLPSDALLRLFDAALAALWIRTKTTLGEVTLTAIAERVLHNVAERLPVFAALTVDPRSGINCGDLRKRAAAVRGLELQDGIRSVLVEFLTVLGTLTAEILTPELHAELYGVALLPGIRVEKTTSNDPVAPAKAERQGKKS